MRGSREIGMHKYASAELSTTQVAVVCWSRFIVRRQDWVAVYNFRIQSLWCWALAKTGGRMHQARNEIRRIVWGLLLAGGLAPVTGWAQATATLPGAVSNMIENGEIAKVKSWLDKGGKVNARGTGDQPALMDAAAYGQLEMVRFFLAHGANPKLRDATNSTVLY